MNLLKVLKFLTSNDYKKKKKNIFNIYNWL